MKHDLKRLTSLLLAVLMAVSMVPAFSIGVIAAESTYTKVTTAPADWSGTYLIVYEAKENDLNGDKAFNGSIDSLDVTSNTVDVDISDNKILSELSVTDLSQVEFTIAKVEGGYSIKSDSGIYIGRSADANELDESATKAYVNTISLAADGTVNIIGAGGAYLRYNSASNQRRFRYYKSSTYTDQNDIALYKLDTTGETGGEESGTTCTHEYSVDYTKSTVKCLSEGNIVEVCGLCGAEKATASTMLYHKYGADGVCTRTDCGAKSPVVDGEFYLTAVDDSGKKYELSADGGACAEYAVSPSKYPLIAEVGDVGTDYTVYYFKTNQTSGTEPLYFGWKTSAETKTYTKSDIAEENKNMAWIVYTTGEVGFEELVIMNVGSGSRTLRFNSGSATKYIRCYSSGYNPVNFTVVEEKSAPEFSHFSVSLNKGITVNATYTIPQTWLDENAGAYLLFKNGEAEEKLTPVAGENTYKITLKPGEIGYALSYGLYTADDAAVISKDISYSKYVEAVKAAGYANLNISEAKYNALISLFDAIKNYSDAANKALSKDLTETFENVSDVTFDGTINSFGDVSATLGEQADVKIAVNTESVLDTYKLNAKLGGKSIADKKAVGEYITADNQVVINGLYPSTFNDDIVIKIFDGETEVSSLTFTFNAYLKALYNSSADQAVKNLAAATYQYGLAAEAYLTADNAQ